MYIVCIHHTSLVGHTFLRTFSTKLPNVLSTVLANILIRPIYCYQVILVIQMTMVTAILIGQGGGYSTLLLLKIMTFNPTETLATKHHGLALSYCLPAFIFLKRITDGDNGPGLWIKEALVHGISGEFARGLTNK